jgi:hypothetical protein
MKKSTISTLAIAAATFVSCNSGINKKEATQQFTPAPATSALPTLSADSASAPAASQPATVALNPAHGAPGHRCDVAVGAPLPSAGASVAPATNVSPVSPVNNVPASVITSPVQSGSTVRLNPPHGQPGHDCSVEVGKPLR